MKITENKKGRCTGCCAAALFAGLDGTYDFLLVAPGFLHPAAKDAKNHLTNSYGVKFLTWQNPEQLFVAQVLIKNIKL